MSLTKEEEALYDRQIRLWGYAAQEKLVSSHVYVLGATAINVEIAKNLVLAGIRLTFADSREISERDFAFNFLLRRSDLGEQIGKVCCPRIQEMNPNIQVKCGDAEMLLKGTLVPSKTKEDLVTIIKQCSVVLVASEVVPVSQQLVINQLCRDLGVAFFVSWGFGKYGCCFCDMVKRPSTLVKDEEERINSLGPWGTDFETCFSLEAAMKAPFLAFPKRETDASIYAFLAVFRQHLKVELKHSKELTTIEMKEKAYAEDLTSDFEGVNEKIEAQARSLMESLYASYNCGFMAAAAVVGGEVAQEIRKFCTRRDMPLGNWITLNCDKSEVVHGRIPF